MPTSRTTRHARASLGTVAALLVALHGSIVTAADPLDWPTWRGPRYNSTSVEKGLPVKWNPRGGDDSNLLWMNPSLAGRSTPIVMGDRLYMLCRHQPATETEGERVVCVSTATGEILWQHTFNVYLSDVPDTRVGWSSVSADPETGRVYAQGVCGYFCCLEGETGKVVWQRSLHEELGLLSTYGGRTNFPLVYKDTVITSAVVIGWGDSPQWGLMAKPAHRFMAFDKATGQLRWLSGTRLIPYDTTYSMPALVKINAQDLLVFGSGDGAVWGMQAGTGETVWSAPLSRRGLNVSPAVSPEGRVYIGHSEENTVGNTMGAYVGIDGTRTGEIADDQLQWKNYQVMAGKSSPLFIDGKVYVVTDSAKLLVFDGETGEQLDKVNLGRVSRGSPLYADGKIYYSTRGGRYYVLKPNADGSVEKLFSTTLRRTQVDASIIASHGRLYLPTSEGLYCIGSDKPTEHEHDSHIAIEPPPTLDEKVAAIRLSPWDSLLAPGEKQTLSVRFFNSTGEQVPGPADMRLSFEVTGPGKVLPDATGWGAAFVAPESSKHQCALVTCKHGDLEATARVRIVPPLPWAFDFEDLDKVPLTWVGGRIRYNLREDESGNHYIAKPIELPTRPGAPTTKLGTRSRMWMGSPDLSNYTVQADVLMKTGTAGESSASEIDDRPPEAPPSAGDSSIKLPSLGLINSRYTFALFGPNNEARLYSWCTHDKRTQAVAAMSFESDAWYTMKLTVEPDQEHGLAHVYGKVWKRGESEPTEWTLEIHDAAPNDNGSPGLFGDAKEAEFYVDNLIVTPN